jgi:hypothetical protein
MSLEARPKTASNVGNMSAAKTLGNESRLSLGQNPFNKEISRRELFKLGAAGVATLTIGDSLKKLVFPEASSAAETVPFTKFEDVPEDYPYHEAIIGMKDAGIIDGYLIDGKYYFKPEDSVKRAQFAKMIVGVEKLPVSETDVCNFTDVEKPTDSLYPDNYIAVAAKNGITKGITPTEFGPYKEIKRAHVTTMMVRAAQNLEPGVLRNPPGGYESIKGNFDPTHAQNLATAEYNGLTAGLVGYEYGSDWSPWAPATRGECAQMLWNLKQKIENAPDGIKGLEGSLITITLQELLQNKEPEVFTTVKIIDSEERRRLDTLYEGYHQGEMIRVVGDANRGDEMNAVVASAPIIFNSNGYTFRYDIEGYGMHMRDNNGKEVPSYGTYVYKGVTLEGADSPGDFVMVFENPETGRIFPMQANLDENDGNNTSLRINNLKANEQDLDGFRGEKYRLFYQLEHGLELVDFIKEGDSVMVFAGSDFNGDIARNSKGLYKVSGLSVFRFEGYDQLKQQLER